MQLIFKLKIIKYIPSVKKENQFVGQIRSSDRHKNTLKIHRYHLQDISKTLYTYMFVYYYYFYNLLLLSVPFVIGENVAMREHLEYRLELSPFNSSQLF